jgi:hypothetical protein
VASNLRRGLFEAEDLLLALWTIGFERLASRAFGADPSSWLETGQGAFTPLAWVVLAGFLFVLLTEHDPQISGEEATNRRVLACGPLFFLPGMAIGLANAFRKKDDWPGPRAPRWLRRAAVVPLGLVADAVVGHHARDAVELASTGLDPFTGMVVPFVATAGVYLFAVVGPRVAAGATVHPGPWILRFASYFVALASSSLIVSRTLTT